MELDYKTGSAPASRQLRARASMSYPKMLLHFIQVALFSPIALYQAATADRPALRTPAPPGCALPPSSAPCFSGGEPSSRKTNEKTHEGPIRLSADTVHSKSVSHHTTKCTSFVLMYVCICSNHPGGQNRVLTRSVRTQSSSNHVR